MHAFAGLGLFLSFPQSRLVTFLFVFETLLRHAVALGPWHHPYRPLTSSVGDRSLRGYGSTRHTGRGAEGDLVKAACHEVRSARSREHAHADLFVCTEEEQQRLVYPALATQVSPWYLLKNMFDHRVLDRMHLFLHSQL